MYLFILIIYNLLSILPLRYLNLKCLKESNNKKKYFFMLVPPRKIEIVGMSAGSRLKIKENEIVELKCLVQEAKPKAHIVWFRENSEFVTGKFHLKKFLSANFC